MKPENFDRTTRLGAFAMLTRLRAASAINGCLNLRRRGLVGGCRIRCETDIPAVRLADDPALRCTSAQTHREPVANWPLLFRKHPACTHRIHRGLIRNVLPDTLSGSHCRDREHNRPARPLTRTEQFPDRRRYRSVSSRILSFRGRRLLTSNCGSSSESVIVNERTREMCVASQAKKLRVTSAPPRPDRGIASLRFGGPARRVSANAVKSPRHD